MLVAPRTGAWIETRKIANVLYVYKQIQVVPKKGNNLVCACLSYDEKPGIQAIENTAPDLPPSPCIHPCVSRDYEYIRQGTLS
ncbi:MAG: hypothetical protein A4E55_00875 [Pelotomaculum sp. PtaU1.Bin035]|nr:MAG: hypothetical protein A4E55_00875 [Pelotomaculum sp. PtaU1.Bin035]